MRKISVVVITILGSGWFALVGFIIGTRSGIEIICQYEKCVRDVEKGDIPDPLFEVMVRLPSDKGRVVSVLLGELPRFQKSHPDASLIMLNSDGETDDKSWKYTAVSMGDNSQVISAHYLDGNRIDVKYQTLGLSVKPLASKVTNVSYMIIATPMGFFVAWLIRFLSRIALLKKGVKKNRVSQ